VTSTNTKPEVVFSSRGRHLEKWIWRHISTVGAPIWTKFGSLIQNNMHITANWSRSKPEVEFQYAGRFYFEIGSTYISAANGDILRKFGLLIDMYLLKAATSTSMKPEVVSAVAAAILRNGYDVIFPQWVIRFGWNSAAWCRKTYRLRRTGRDQNRK